VNTESLGAKLIWRLAFVTEEDYRTKFTVPPCPKEFKLVERKGLGGYGNGLHVVGTGNILVSISGLAS
jgi:hypothetical protein